MSSWTFSIEFDNAPRRGRNTSCFPKATIRARSSRLLKRVVDLVVGGIALVAISPLFAFIALRIKMDSPGPVFYRSTRVGLGGKTFLWFAITSFIAS